MPRRAVLENVSCATRAGARRSRWRKHQHELLRLPPARSRPSLWLHASGAHFSLRISSRRPSAVPRPHQSRSASCLHKPHAPLLGSGGKSSRARGSARACVRFSGHGSFPRRKRVSVRLCSDEQRAESRVSIPGFARACALDACARTKLCRCPCLPGKVCQQYLPARRVHTLPPSESAALRCLPRWTSLIAATAGAGRRLRTVSLASPSLYLGPDKMARLRSS